MTGERYRSSTPAFSTAAASPLATRCMPPSGTTTPSTASMYVMTAYSASASYGARPAYIDWNEKIRCRRWSRKYEPTTRASRRKAPILTRCSAGASGRARSSTES